MNRVYQHGEYDSAAACLATVLGLKKAQDVYPWLGYNPNEGSPRGVGTPEVMSILSIAGYSVKAVVTKEFAKNKLKIENVDVRVQIPSELVLRHKLGALQTGSAIVTVHDSRADRWGDPFIIPTRYLVCIKGEVFDPSPVDRYIGSAQSLPVEYAIFIEAKT